MTRQIGLTPRDRELLAFLAEKKAAPIDVVASRFFSKNPLTGAPSANPLAACLRRMDALTDAGFLRREPLAGPKLAGDVAPVLVVLGPKGAKTCDVELAAIHPRHRDHHVATMRAVEALRLEVEQKGGRVVEVKLEHELLGATYRGAQNARGTQHDAFPDAVVVVELPKAPAGPRVELDVRGPAADASARHRVAADADGASIKADARVAAELVHVRAQGDVLPAGAALGVLEKHPIHVQGDAAVVAEARASGRASIGLDGVAAEGHVRAVAGASAQVAVEEHRELRGQRVLTARAELEGIVGVGLRADGVLGIEQGRLRVGAGLGAAAGLGGGARLELEVDGRALAKAFAEPRDRGASQAGVDGEVERVTYAVEYVTGKYRDRDIAEKAESFRTYDAVRWVADTAATSARVSSIAGAPCTTL